MRLSRKLLADDAQPPSTVGAIALHLQSVCFTLTPPAPQEGEGRRIETTGQFLLCHVAGRVCALPLANVVEIMRPLPVTPVAGAPAAVSGVAIIRGGPVPVVDLVYLIFGDRSDVARFITLRVGTRLLALAVGDVIGVRNIPQRAYGALPRLFNDAPDALASIGTHDEELLVVLRASHLLPESEWPTLEGDGAPA